MRYDYDLSHPVLQCGKLGQIQTLSRFVVLPGDSLGFSVQGEIRLSPLRRWVSVDPKIDLCAFYIPHRHCYGDDWQTYIKEGIDETITFPHYTGTPSLAYPLLGTHKRGTLAKWMVDPYAMIWNRYFRVPSDEASIIDLDEVQSWLTSLSHERRAFGYHSARLKTHLTTMLYTEPDPEDRQVVLSGTSPQQKLDIVELGKVKARYASEQARDWFAPVSYTHLTLPTKA